MSETRQETASGVTSVGEDDPREQERCRELLRWYESIGPAGAFGAMSIRETLREADIAALSGDLPRMLASYERMRRHE